MRMGDPNILIVYDVDGWAYHRRALALRRYAPPGYNVAICSGPELAFHLEPDKKHVPRIRDSWDVVMLLDLGATGEPYRGGRCRLVRFVGSSLWCHESYRQDDWRTKGVHQHRCLSVARPKLAIADAVGVHNEYQRRNLRAFNGNTRVMPYLVDLAVFQNHGRRTWAEGSPLRVGWCGQLNGGRRNPKGFVEVMVPAMTQLSDRDYEWHVNVADANECYDTIALVKWYNEIDVLVCTSTSEGGPQTIFEAAACGCAVISTAVGEAADWQELDHSRMRIACPRNSQEGVEAVRALVDKLRALQTARHAARTVAGRLEDSIRRKHNAATLSPAQLAFIAGDK